jgi:hypothetical protein
MLPRNAKGSVGATESCPWQRAIAHAKELEAGRRYRVPSAPMHQRGRSSWPLFSSRSPGSRTSTPTRSMHTRSLVVPWHVPSFCKRHARQHLSIWHATIATTAIAARLRDAKSESTQRPALQHAAPCATCMQHQSCAGRTRFHLSVLQCYAVQIQLLRGQHHANRSHH